jgi:C4-dicarboxylate transporter DctQ subunit
MATRPLASGVVSRLMRAIDRATRTVIATALGVALLLACQEIMARYLLPQSALDWSFELIVFLIIWAMFLAMSQLAARGAHIRVDLVVRLLPRRGRHACDLIATMLGLAVALTLFVSGVLVVSQSVEWDERTTSSLALPLWLYYLSLPVGSALLGLQLSVRLAALLFSLPLDGDHSELAS